MQLYLYTHIYIYFTLAIISPQIIYVVRPVKYQSFVPANTLKQTKFSTDYVMITVTTRYVSIYIPSCGAVSEEYVEVLHGQQFTPVDTRLDGTQTTQYSYLVNITHNRFN